ncbi:hypothetical protein BGX23_004199 [Mortierella sp. AD031]|nr:hypothetical protein BGX23_004199 [Mortierella sp. AD031]
MSTNAISLTIKTEGNCIRRTVIDSIARVRSLKRLTFEFVLPIEFNRFPSVDLRPTLQGLQELTTYGPWYTLDDQEANCKEQAGNKAKWNMRILRMTTDDLGLLSYCPRLKHLEATTMHNKENHSISFAAVQACPELHTLRAMHPKIPDLIKVLKSLKKIQSLAFTTTSAQEIAYIAEESEEEALLPQLVDLEIHAKNLHRNAFRQFDTCLFRILSTRDLLTSIVIKDYEVQSTTTFEQSWTCSGIETLELNLAQGNSGREQRMGIWDRVFRKLGRLVSLKSLTLRSADLQQGITSSVHFLQEIQMLEELTLSDHNKGMWTQEQLTRILDATPNLAHLAIGPLHQSQTMEILRDWIENAERDPSILGNYYSF